MSRVQAARPVLPIPRETERTVGAYAVLLLVDAGLIPRGKAQEAFKALGCQNSDQVQAFDRFTHRRYDKLDSRTLDRIRLISDAEPTVPDARLPDPPSRAAPQPAMIPVGPITGKSRPTQALPNRRDGRNGPERRCATCEDWHPATSAFFPWKDRQAGTLRSYCYGCWSTRQQTHYMSTAQQEALAEAGVFFAASGVIVGQKCAGCRRKICDGEPVQGRTVFRHELCATPLK